MQEQDLKCGRWISVCFSFTLLAGMITFAVATFVYSKKAREYEAGFTAVESLLTPCEQARDFCLAEQNETQRALVICTTQEQPTPAACPPAPECPAPPTCPDPVIVDLGTEWDQRVDRAITQAQSLREAYQARMQEFLPVLQKAKDLGIGPRIRDWINNPEAVQTLIEMSVRWGEVERADNEMRAVLDRVHNQMSEFCWQNKQNRQGARLQEMYPDYGLHERVRREMFELTNYHMLSYVCMDEVARQAAEQQP